MFVNILKDVFELFLKRNRIFSGNELACKMLFLHLKSARLTLFTTKPFQDHLCVKKDVASTLAHQQLQFAGSDEQ